MSMLSALFGFGGGETATNQPGQAGVPGPSATLTAEETHALAAEWQKSTAAYKDNLEKVMKKLVDENNEMKARVLKAETELSSWKAGRREDTQTIAKLKKELGLANGLEGPISSNLIVTILDFEADLFAPALFYRTSGEIGRNAARTLRDQIRTHLPKECSTTRVDMMTFIFLTRKEELVPDLCSEGFFQSPADFDEFLASFNRAHPLFLIISDSAPKAAILQRQRALATIFSRVQGCKRLILGRWALDYQLAEMISVPTGKTKSQNPESGVEENSNQTMKFPDKVRFVEPFTTTIIPPEFKKRAPVFASFVGVLRTSPLRRGPGKFGRPQLNPNKPLAEQNPPICLSYYLRPNRCARESCPFAHSYSIPSHVLESLSQQLRATPCPIMNSGVDCVIGIKNCFFGHNCPKGFLCERIGCPFPQSIHKVEQPVEHDSTTTTELSGTHTKGASSAFEDSANREMKISEATRKLNQANSISNLFTRPRLDHLGSEVDHMLSVDAAFAQAEHDNKKPGGPSVKFASPTGSNKSDLSAKAAARAKILANTGKSAPSILNTSTSPSKLGRTSIRGGVPLPPSGLPSTLPNSPPKIPFLTPQEFPFPSFPDEPIHTETTFGNNPASSTLIGGMTPAEFGKLSAQQQSELLLGATQSNGNPAQPAVHKPDTAGEIPAAGFGGFVGKLFGARPVPISNPIVMAQKFHPPLAQNLPKAKSPPIANPQPQSNLSPNKQPTIQPQVLSTQLAGDLIQAAAGPVAGTEPIDPHGFLADLPDEEYLAQLKMMEAQIPLQQEWLSKHTKITPEVTRPWTEAQDYRNYNWHAFHQILQTL